MVDAAMTAVSRLPVEKLDRLGAMVAEKIGLCFPENKRKDLWRAAVKLSREHGYPDPEAYIDFLLSSTLAKEQVEVLAIHLTVGETYFFRETKSLEALRDHILPDLIRERSAGSRKIRIWSAGCSSGEEPYTAAMLIDRLLPRYQDWDVKIMGTDINCLALEKARSGIYTSWSFRGTPGSLRDRYFVQTGPNTFVLKSAIKRMVTFSYLNLATDNYPSLVNDTSRQDLIFCRNVIIYLTPDVIRKVVHRFYRSLNDGGWMVVAPSETFSLNESLFSPVSFSGTTLFRRTSDKSGKRLLRSDPLPRVPDRDTQPGFAPMDLMTVPLLPSGSDPGSLEPSRPSKDKEHGDLYKRALASFEKGRHQDARSILETLLDKPAQTRERIQALALMSRLLANQGDLKQAAGWCKKALLVNKTDPELYHLLAMIYLEQGRDFEAARELKRSIYIDPDFIAAHYALGSIALGQGKGAEARRHFQNAAALLNQVPDKAGLSQLGDISAGRMLEIIRGLMNEGGGS